MSDVSRPVRHASPQFRTLPVFVAMVALFALVAIALGVAAGLLDLFLGRVSIPQPSPPDLPAPKLQIDPQADLLALRERDRIRLHERAAVPIGRAMELVAQRGSDAYAPWLAPPAGPEGQPP